MKAFFKVVGLFFFALILLGLGGRIFLALRAGKAFYGENYYGQPLGIYSTLAVFAVAAVIILIFGLRWFARLFGRASKA